jgi:hypothetical protein
MSQETIVGEPIFVVGSPRSGTSILTWCLGQHPNLLAVPESNWMSRFAIDTAVAHRRGSCRGEYSQLYAMELTRDRLMQDIGMSINQSIIDHRSAYLKHRESNAATDRPLTFQLERDVSDPKARWVNGTPEYSLGICGLRKLFPSALFIHIVRHCDKVVASMLHFHRLGEKNLAETEVEGFQKWERYVRAVVAAEEAYGSPTILRLFYEDLIEAPEKCLRQALDFAGESFSPDCLDPLTNRINSSSVNSDYSLPPELDDHPEVKRARDLWADLRRGSPVAAGDRAAAQRVEEQFEKYVDHFYNLDTQHARAQSALKQLQGEFSQRAAWALELDAQIERKDQLILQLQSDLADRTAWALKLDEEIERKGQLILQLQDEVSKLSAWGRSLDKHIAEKDALIVNLQNTCTERANWALTLQTELDRRIAKIRDLQRKVAKFKDLKGTSS